MRSIRKIGAGLAAASLVLGLTACSSQGGAQNDAAATQGQRYTIAMITHEQAGDTFWDKIRAGAEDAAATHGIDLKYSNNEQGPEQATLVQNAIDSKVNGIAVTLSSADAVVPVAKKAADAGIPVVAFNQGIDQYKAAGAKMYFGSDESLAGQTVGQKLAQTNPGGKVLCVIQAQGSVALETRCEGVKKAYPNTENIQVNGADLPSVQQTLNAKLSEDKSITDIVTLGAPIALAAMQAQEGTGSTAKIATFDLNQDAAKAIQDGKILFSVDQQPYVQGYMAVESLWLNLSNGNDLGGGKPVLTGPSLVDSSNIGQILPYTQANKR
ncbi:substrate-binding domain-containing protein [Pseudonocardia sp. DR1-2]|jgi:simple sugar transport system substrate-binding protein|uniref:substrate-binding domain-containing protein n=1 Tax=Pseudonocardia sp. DR1-2 TaxID=2951168 RepID=UPI002043BC0B|nr:substrate-binding domain-containing protein [Pseudonocardia sp. DR1-2]MCM3845346.1 substrate-binding domain-containing protein [Pseudonocardia sp. DR1-2]